MLCQRSVVLGLLERCRRRIEHVDELVGALSGCDQLVTDTERQIHDTAAAFVQVCTGYTRYTVFHKKGRDLGPYIEISSKGALNGL